jgi:hypothetical protein
MPRNGKDENTARPLRYPTPSDSIQSHVSLDRLVALLLSGTPLEPEEHTHLLRCNECTVAMVRTAKEELGKRRPRK